MRVSSVSASRGEHPVIIIILIALLVAMEFSQASSFLEQEDVDGEDRKVLKENDSPTEEFIYMLANTVRSRWGDLWHRKPPPPQQHQPQRLSVRDEPENDGEGEKEEDGGIEEGGDDGALTDQVKVMASLTPTQQDIFDIRRMKRKLQLKKFSNYQRNHNDRQRKRQQRRRQQRKKLMRTVARSKKNRFHKADSARRWGGNHKGQGSDHSTERNQTSPERPNIILIVADDLGFNDVPWHNPDVRAPNLLRLARQGILLENHYVLPLCTPSRAALLTGDYPFRYGKQAGETSPLSPTGLNTSVTLLPQRLKALGYNTHLIGKWHLGYCSWDYTPTRRGFDSFYGFYLGSQTYYTQYKKLGPKKGSSSWLDTNNVDYNYSYKRDHLSGSSSGSTDHLKNGQLQSLRERRPRGPQLDLHEDGGRDFRFNEMPLSNVSGIYSNDLYASRAEEIIRAHAARAGGTTKRGRRRRRSATEPLFMMLSLQAVHGPIQVPLNYRRRHTDTKNLARRTFLGMVNALDDVVGRVVAQLKASGLYRNSLIVFTTDNGGNIQAGGNNFPLRGSKGGVFEGGTRGVAFIHSPLLPKSGYKYDGMMHIVDLHETILHVAQSNTSVPRGNGWRKALLQTSAESESTLQKSSSSTGGQKRTRDGINMWPAILTNSESPRNSFVYNVRKKPLRGAIRRKNWKLIIGNGGRYDGWVPPSDVSAGSQGADDGRCCTTWHSRMLSKHVKLFNLKDDPLETTDVAYLHPDVTSTLKSLLRKYAAQSRQPHMARDEPQGHPSLHGGFFSPGWCQAVG